MFVLNSRMVYGVVDDVVSNKLSFATSGVTVTQELEHWSDPHEHPLEDFKGVSVSIQNLDIDIESSSWRIGSFKQTRRQHGVGTCRNWSRAEKKHPASRFRCWGVVSCGCKGMLFIPWDYTDFNRFQFGAFMTSTITAGNAQLLPYRDGDKRLLLSRPVMPAPQLPLQISSSISNRANYF